MDADNTQWLVKPKDEEFKAYRWSGVRADLLHSPEWLRSLVYDWKFEEFNSFRYSVKLFYRDPNSRSLTVNPGDFALRVGERLIVLNSGAFNAIFMEEDPTSSVENET